MCGANNCTCRNIRTAVIKHPFRSEKLRLAGGILVCNFQSNWFFSSDSDQISCIEREQKIRIAHWFPIFRRRICYHRLLWQLPFDSIRRVDWNKIISIILHMEHVNANHASIVCDAAAGCHIQAAFPVSLHLIDYRSQHAVLFRLVERLSKCFLPISVKLLQPFPQCFVQQAVAGGVIIILDFSIFIQLQVGQRCLDNRVPRQFPAADRLFMGRAAHFPIWHPGDEHRADDLLRVVVRQGSFGSGARRASSS